jgi:transposase
MVDKEKKAKGRKGIRYTPEQKKEILDYIKANPGRGTMKDAQDKFGVSYIAIRNWLQEAGEGGIKSFAVKERAAQKSPAEYNKFESLKALVEEIGSREKELKVLYAQVNRLLTT